MKAPNGKGMFIQFVSACEGGSPEAIVARAQGVGLGHILVKFADGRNDHATENGTALPSYHPPIRRLLPVASQAGLEVWGWSFIYGHDAAGEGSAQGQWAKELGFAGVVVDVETSGDDGSGRYAQRPDLARAYMSALRAAVGDLPIGISSYWKPSSHAELPWDEFVGAADLVMPQVYWNGADPVAELQRSVSEFSQWGKPFIPTGGDLNEHPLPTRDEIMRFAAEAERLKCPAINWWEWAEATAEQWRAIGEVKWPARPPAEYHLVGLDGHEVPDADLSMGADGHGRGLLAKIVAACGRGVTWNEKTSTWTIVDLGTPSAGGEAPAEPS